MKSSTQSYTYTGAHTQTHFNWPWELWHDGEQWRPHKNTNSIPAAAHQGCQAPSRSEKGCARECGLRKGGEIGERGAGDAVSQSRQTLNSSGSSAGGRGAHLQSWETEADRPWGHHAGEPEHPGRVTPKPFLPFSFNSQPHFSSRFLLFSRACLSPSGVSCGLREHYLPDLCSFNSTGMCTAWCPERTDSQTEARETDKTSQLLLVCDTENP